jgi:hypothetical protein
MSYESVIIAKDKELIATIYSDEGYQVGQW